MTETERRPPFLNDGNATNQQGYPLPLCQNIITLGGGLAGYRKQVGYRGKGVNRGNVTLDGGRCDMIHVSGDLKEGESGVYREKAGGCRSRTATQTSGTKLTITYP